MPLLFGLLAFVAPAHAQSADEKTATLQYIYGLQAADGGFAADATMATPTLRSVVPALRTIRYLGGSVPKEAETTRFVLRCRDAATGGFGNAPGQQPGVALTAVGIMTAVELKVPAEQYRAAAEKYLAEWAQDAEDIRLCAAAYEALQSPAPKAKDWLDIIGKSRNQDGTFGAGAGIVRATGGMTALTLRLGGAVANRDAVTAVLKNGQRPDGGYGKAETPTASDLETTYRVVRSLVMLKELPADIGKLRAFVAKCRNADGGYGVAPGQSSSVAATYYATILRHWLADARP